MHFCTVPVFFFFFLYMGGSESSSDPRYAVHWRYFNPVMPFQTGKALVPPQIEYPLLHPVEIITKAFADIVPFDFKIRRILLPIFREHC